MQLFSYFRSWITFKNYTSTWLLTPFSSSNSKQTIQQVKQFWINVKGCNKPVNLESLSTVLALIGTTKCIANRLFCKCRFIPILCHSMWCNHHFQPFSQIIFFLKPFLWMLDSVVGCIDDFGKNCVLMVGRMKDWSSVLETQLRFCSIFLGPRCYCNTNHKRE